MKWWLYCWSRYVLLEFDFVVDGNPEVLLPGYVLQLEQMILWSVCFIFSNFLSISIWHLTAMNLKLRSHMSYHFSPLRRSSWYDNASSSDVIWQYMYAFGSRVNIRPLMLISSSTSFMTKRTGPKTAPCGIMLMAGATFDVDLLTTTSCVLSWKRSSSKWLHFTDYCHLLSSQSWSNSISQNILTRWQHWPRALLLLYFFFLVRHGQKWYKSTQTHPSYFFRFEFWVLFSAQREMQSPCLNWS